MALRPTGHELTQQAIEAMHQRAIDAYTIEDALRCHSELIDLLAIEAMIIRVSARSEVTKAKMIRVITDRVEYHRDVIERLSRIIETGQQLIWRP